MLEKNEFSKLHNQPRGYQRNTKCIRAFVVLLITAVVAVMFISEETVNTLFWLGVLAITVWYIADIISTSAKTERVNKEKKAATEKKRDEEIINKHFNGDSTKYYEIKALHEQALYDSLNVDTTGQPRRPGTASGLGPDIY